MSTFSKVTLYAGPLDGGEIEASQGDTRFVLPVMGQPNAVYRASPEWSAHLKRRVAVHDAFPGMPPQREPQPA